MQGDLACLRQGWHRQPLRHGGRPELERRRPEEAGRALERHLHLRPRQLGRLLSPRQRGERGADHRAGRQGRPLLRRLRPARRLVQHRLQREHGHHLRRVREDDARHRHHRRHPAHGQRHRGGRLLHVRRGDRAGHVLQGQRRRALRPRPIARRVHPHPYQRSVPRGRRQEDLLVQRGQLAQLGPAHPRLHQLVQGEQVRRALRRLDGE
mmetsp:Transcript_15364/g.38098  ORF Transcript_15364/g.38098 Transcript_15364/m.38098 type:complete len:209 (+) Transcript_15364:189-815(+)